MAQNFAVTPAWQVARAERWTPWYILELADEAQQGPPIDLNALASALGIRLLRASNNPGWVSASRFSSVKATVWYDQNGPQPEVRFGAAVAIGRVLTNPYGEYRDRIDYLLNSAEARRRNSYPGRAYALGLALVAPKAWLQHEVERFGINIHSLAEKFNLPAIVIHRKVKALISQGEL